MYGYILDKTVLFEIEIDQGEAISLLSSIDYLSLDMAVMVSKSWILEIIC